MGHPVGGDLLLGRPGLHALEGVSVGMLSCYDAHLSLEAAVMEACNARAKGADQLSGEMRG